MFTSPCRLFPQPLGAVLPEYCQSFAVWVEVGEGEVRASSVVVLGQAPIPYFVETKDTLNDAEHMLHLRPEAGLTLVLIFM